MKKFLQYHVGSLVAWIVVLVIAFGLMPNTSALVRDQGATKVPSDMQSQVATAIQNKWGHGQDNTRQVAVVFSNGNHRLTAGQTRAINATVNRLQDNRSQYHIKSILAPTDNAETKKQLIAKDGTTQIVQLMVGKQQTVRQMTNAITKAAKTSGVTTYVTGGDILTDDFSQATEEGIKKTEVIAAIFIFIVLIIVFRSPVVPVVSLGMVGVALMTSMSLVFNLAKWFNFPISSFTQVFIVVILFGIGTDYNILLYDQFKASLSHGHSAVEATKRSRKVAGRTILYSGSSVLIGFSALGLANFSIYKSAVGVAISVAVLLIVLLTLNPFFMAVLGKKMFWPIKNFDGASHSKLWEWLSAHSVLHPLIALGITALCALPMLFMYNGKLNYNTVDELSSSVPAKQGFQVIQTHFSKGMAEPNTLYIRSNKRLDQNQYLKTIDQLTRKLKQEPGIKTVASVTQPGGSEVKDLYVKRQLKTVTTGMAAAHQGLGTINKGLTSANKQLAGADMQSGLTGVKQLITGSNQLIAGVDTLQSGAGQLNSGAWQLTSGLDQYTGAVGQINSGAAQLTANSAALRAGANQLNSSVASLSGLGNQLTTAQQSLAQLPAMQQEITTIQTELAAQPNLNADLAKAVTLLDSLDSDRDQITSLTTQASSLGTMLSTTKKTVTSVGVNDEKAAKGDKQIIKQAQSIVSDTNASADSKKAAQAIIDQANKNIDQRLTVNTQKLTALNDATKNISLPNSQTLTALTAQLPSADQVKQMKAELTTAQTVLKQSNTLMTNASQLTASAASMSKLMADLPSLMKQLSQVQTLANGIVTYTNGVDTLAGGTQQLASKSGQLTTGADQLLAGTNTLTNSVPALRSGLVQERDGQQTMYTTLAGLVGQMGKLQTGLSQATGGLSKIDHGVVSANDYLGGLRRSASTKEFYIPTSVLTSKTFKPALTQYLSEDKKATQLTIVFDTDPSSAASLDKVNALQKEVKNQLKGTPLAGSTVAIGGQTAFTADTRAVASKDFIRTAAIMLIGIAIALMVITRSLLQPIYILGTLLLAYISSLTLTRLLSHVVLGQAYLTWNTPFFGFIMLVALGVDYSIFLMMKYREFGPDTPGASITRASGIIGAVVISAAVILGGTFAALIPSGVLTLIQVALTVMIGLVILVVFLPITLSAGIRLTYGKAKTK